MCPQTPFPPLAISLQETCRQGRYMTLLEFFLQYLLKVVIFSAAAEPISTRLEVKSITSHIFNGRSPFGSTCFRKCTQQKTAGNSYISLGCCYLQMNFQRKHISAISLKQHRLLQTSGCPLSHIILLSSRGKGKKRLPDYEDRWRRCSLSKDFICVCRSCLSNNDA